jgi:WD40 repeat protein
LAAATCQSKLHLYDPVTLGLLQTQQTNQSRINNVLFADNSTLMAVHQDGTIWVQDVRQTTTTTPTMNFCLPRPAPHLPPEPALCLSMGFDNTILAVGSEQSKIHSWDVRKHAQLLGSYVDCHTQAVSQVHFDNNNNHAGHTFLMVWIILPNFRTSLRCVLGRRLVSPLTTTLNAMATLTVRSRRKESSAQYHPIGTPTRTVFSCLPPYS